jgi:hypothetical protein
VDRAVVRRVGDPVGAQVVDDVVLVAPGEFLRSVPEHFRCRRVDECNPLAKVQAEDALGDGGQDRLVLVREAFDVLLIPLAFGYVAGDRYDGAYDPVVCL